MKSLLLFIICSVVLLNCTSQKKTISSNSQLSSTAKPDANLEGTYWKLTELNGNAIVGSDEFTHEPYFILQTRDSTIKGNGGCNGFGGKYSWRSPNRINISGIISTMMACAKIDVENTYFKMLQSADSYYIKGDTLILNRARMAPLARFTAVYLK
jgi:heat shock protein HslJ